MITEEQIASLVADYIDGYPYAAQSWRGGLVWTGPRPAVEDVRDSLLKQAENQALSLGDLFRTPEGKLIEAGVALVIPPTYAFDFKLFVDAVALASREQQRVGRDRAGKFALVATAVIVFAALLGD